MNLLQPIVRSLMAITAMACCGPSARALEPLPDKLVVLTFDDSVSSHHAVVAPLLKQLGFGATFFITEGFSFRTNKQDYLTWEQIAGLHRDGFEVGLTDVEPVGASGANVLVPCATPFT